MDTMPPEAFLAPYPTDMRAIAQRLRRIVLSARPDAIERVRAGWHLNGYDVPTTIGSGRKTVYFAYVAPEREHVHLGFEHGVAMRDPGGLLQGRGVTNQVRWLTFRPGDPIDVTACTELIHEAVRVAMLSRAERAFAAMDADAEPDAANGSKASGRG
jgi:hypothetical protein